MKKVEVSIIIVNWNTRKLVVDCINSIISSKPKVSYEIIVVDNGSVDDSVKEVKKIKINNLRVIENKENLGFSKANNIGIKECLGEYILLLNSDTKIKGKAIDSLYNFAKGNSTVGVVGAKLLNQDGSLQESCFHFPTVGNTIREFWFGEKGLLAKFAPKNNIPVEVDVVVGAAFLITPKALKKVGAMDERYFFFFEDLEYCRQVRRAGLKVVYLPDAEVYHYHGSTIRKITQKDDAWRNLIPGSKIYHGLFKHYLLFLITWSGQKFLRGK